MYAAAPGVSPGLFAFQGRLDTKEEAKAAIEESYARFMAATPDARAYWQKSCGDLNERMARFQAMKGGTLP